MSHLFIPRPIDGLTTVRGPAARAARVCASGLIVEYARRTYFGIGPASGYAAGLISVVALFLPITPKASGIVVRPPTNARASPAALRWSLFSLLESKSPIPAPRATRVPAMRMISAILSFRSIIVPPTFVPAIQLGGDISLFRCAVGFGRLLAPRDRSGMITQLS